VARPCSSSAASELAIEAGDPAVPIAERFARVGEIAVIDLDAAIGRAPTPT
jgi:hypothetical protein